MLQISKEECEKCKIEVIANWAQIFDKCDSKKLKYRQELTPNAKYQQCRVFVRNEKLKATENHQKGF